ncbi:MAG: aspartate kinase [Cenarchaeum symbiont of Oopsacas minuta]|nr:aspartate kinase [Cenarchaeum symbiont of Oopsacas minuta]
MRLVVKYDGSTILTPKKINIIAKQVYNESKNNQMVLVCSAIGDTTDHLLGITNSIHKNDVKGAKALAASIIDSHKKMAQQTITKATGRKKLVDSLTKDFEEFLELVNGIAILNETTPRSLDYLISFGERFSAKILSYAIADLGRKTQSMTGKEVGIVTDSNYGNCMPLMNTTRLRVFKNIETLLSKKITPVIGGFSGGDQHGHITTMGRGGSDYTASIIASCVKADEIWLVGDTDGMMTADPSVVDNAKIIREVSYSEAMEMSMFGAQQIHPKTFEPLFAKKIPMRIRSVSSKTLGTLVLSSPSADVKKSIKCVSAFKNNTIVDIRGTNMAGAPGTAVKIFDTLAAANVNIMMITQNPSESSITITVKKTDTDKTVHIMEKSLLGKIIKKIEVTPNMTIVALIGAGMRGTVGAAARVFGAVAKKSVNVAMITQGSSELNLAFVVRDSDSRKAVKAVHDEFKLGH